MAMIDSISWRPDGENIFAWHYPNNNLTTYTQLVVMESQEAVLFKEGQMIGKFGPGRHTLDTKNLPILHKLYGIPFGGNNPFTAEVWFINVLMPLNIPYKTASFRYHDPDYKTMVPLYIQGRYGLKISDVERFLKKLVGTSERFTGADITDHFQGEIGIKLISSVSTFMQANTIGIKAISSYLERISTTLKSELTAYWADYGIDLTAFYVVSIDIDDSKPEGQEILKAMSQQSAQSIAGYTWQQGKSFNVAEKALTSDSEFGILGALMMAGGGLFGGGATPAALTPTPPTAGAETKSHGQVSESVGEVFCSKCAKKYPASSKFCPFCGDVYNPCPKCGTDNAVDVSQCVNCGTVFKEAGTEICAKCGKTLLPGAAFCQECGATTSVKCPRCQIQVKDSLTFCPNCGKKLK